MKKNFLVAFISILIISTVVYAASYVIHDYDTGIMHMAQDIYLTNTNSVQTQIDSIETNLNGSYALKSGTLSQFTGGTNLNQIATRNHSDLQNINGSESYQHLTTAEVANITLKSGSLTQLTTRNHNDLQNLNATSAHPSASIDNTSTSYGKGLATTDNTVQKIADRVNQNGTPQFVTDASKCSLLLDFKDGLADKTRGIVPVNYNSANKWTDGYVNDSNIKTSATNISCTLKQFEGDEGKFGSGVAVEESRTNLFLNSQNIGNGVISPVGNNGVSFNNSGNSNAGTIIANPLVGVTNTTYTFSFWVKSLSGHSSLTIVNSNWTSAGCSLGDIFGIDYTPNKWVRYSVTFSLSSTTGGIIIKVGDYTVNNDLMNMDGFQLEAGAFPTSYIATGANAVTRPTPLLTYEKPDMLNSNNYSLSFWVKHNFAWDDLVSFAHGLFSFGGTGITHTIYYDARYKQYQICFGAGLNGYELGAANFNDWKHFIVTQNGTIGKVYINNVKILEVSNATPIDFSALTLGRYYGFAIDSIIADFVIFNYALSADEISQIYNSGLEGKPIAITNPENIIPVGQSLHDTNFITFASGWGISSTYPNKPTFSNHDGVAMLRGIVEFAGAVNSDVTLFTLPVGARPSLPDTYYNSFIVSSRDSGAPSARILRVYGNGDVVLMAQGATITNPAISLDGINFVNGK